MVRVDRSLWLVWMVGLERTIRDKRFLRTERHFGLERYGIQRLVWMERMVRTERRQWMVRLVWSERIQRMVWLVRTSGCGWRTLCDTDNGHGCIDMRHWCVDEPH